MEIIIRDLRKKEKFQVDDEYLNGYAKLCGPNATLVYLCLCRHADYYTQTCFPSIESMAEKLGISTDSVGRGLASLVEWQIVLKERTRHPDNAKWVNNSYTLLDKSEWKPKPHRPERDGKATPQIQEPHRKLGKSHTAVSGSKVHTYKKDTHIATASPVAPWNFKNYLKAMHDHKNRHVQIIAFYFEEKRLTFDNKEQAQSAIRRHLRAAKSLVPFSDDQIVKAAKQASSEYPDFTIETLLKILTR